MRIPTERSLLTFIVGMVFIWTALIIAAAMSGFSSVSAWSATEEAPWPPPTIEKRESSLLESICTSNCVAETPSPDDEGPTIWVLGEITYTLTENTAGGRTDETGVLAPGAQTIFQHIEWPIDANEPPVYIDHEASFKYPPYLISGQPESFWLMTTASVSNEWLSYPYEYWIHYAAHSTIPYYYNAEVTCPNGVDMRQVFGPPLPTFWLAEASCSYDPDVELWPELAAAGGDQFTHTFSGRTGWLSEDFHYYEFNIPLTYRRCIDLETCPVEARTQVQSQGDGWLLNDRSLAVGEADEVDDGDVLTHQCSSEDALSTRDLQTCPRMPVEINAECAKEKQLAWDTAMLFIEPMSFDHETAREICRGSLDALKCYTRLVEIFATIKVTIGKIAMDLVECSETPTDLLYTDTSSLEADAPEVLLAHKGGMLRYTVDNADLRLTVETELVSVNADGPGIFAAGHLTETNETFVYAIDNAVTIAPNNAQQSPFVLEPSHVAIVDPESVQMIEVSYDVYLPSVFK